MDMHRPSRDTRARSSLQLVGGEVVEVLHAHENRPKDAVLVGVVLQAVSGEIE